MNAKQITIGGVPILLKDAEARALIGSIQGALTTLNGKVPAQASAQNQLADKEFVNSSISTATATHRGTFNLVSDLSLTISATQIQIATALASAVLEADNNDYVFVQVPTANDKPTEIARIDRYKFNGAMWSYEYSLNNSGFTAVQWAAINSGITSSKITEMERTIGEKYTKPSGGIPNSDLAGDIAKGKLSSGVQQSLNKADNSESQSNKVTSLSDHPTNDEYPSAKLLDDLLKALIKKLLEGDLIPLLAENLEPWADQDDLTVRNSWLDHIRTTAGSAPIATDKGGQLVSIIPQTDFAISALKTSGYNQLRLVANNGLCFEVDGGGYAFPVPKLTFGDYGSARENNGVLFTNSEGENLNPTVRFQPLASGAPTSTADGTALSAQSDKATANLIGGIYTDHDLKFYLTPGPGWLIVTAGITWAETCAHIAWEDWYGKYVGPTDPDDGGDSIVLSGIQNALHSDVKKFLTLGSGGNVVSDRAKWNGTTARWDRYVGLASSPSWTNTPDEVEPGATQTYTHSITISAMKSDGKAEFYGNAQALSVKGTVVSYQDENAAAIDAPVKYELASPATSTNTGTLSIDPAYVLNDCGVEVMDGASGSAFLTAVYARNIADALAEIAAHDLNDITSAIAQMLVNLNDRIAAIEENISGGFTKLITDDLEVRHAVDDFSTEGNANRQSAGAPDFVPIRIGERVFDKTNKVWYTAAGLTTEDWKLDTNA